MDVILNKDVSGVGKNGQIVKVKDGFARNFLIPNGLAVPVNSTNLKRLEEQKQKKTLELEKSKKEAENTAAKLSGMSLTIPVLTQDEDKLYGSISATDIINALKEENINIDKNRIVLDEPIKALGIYEVGINLHPEVAAKIKVWVVKK